MPDIGYGFDYVIFDTALFDETGSDDFVTALTNPFAILSCWYTFGGVAYYDLLTVESITLPTLLQPGSAVITIADSVTWNIFRTPASQEAAFSTEIRLYMSISGVGGSMLLYTGFVNKAVYYDNVITLYIFDRLAELLNTRIGTSDNPVAKPSNRSAAVPYTETGLDDFRRQNPLSLIWNIITNYSDLDGLAAPANPDIDYNSWATAWVAADTLNYSLSWSSSGTTLRDAIAEIADHCNLFVGIDEAGRLHFSMAYSFGEVFAALDHSNMTDFKYEIDKHSVSNKIKINSRYSWITGKWTTSDITVGSYNNYGRRDKLYDSRSVYHDGVGNDTSATNFANTIIDIINIPNMTVRITTTAIGFLIRPGRLFTVTESNTELVADTFVCTSINLNVNDASTTLIGRKPAAVELA